MSKISIDSQGHPFKNSQIVSPYRQHDNETTSTDDANQQSSNDHPWHCTTPDTQVTVPQLSLEDNEQNHRRISDKRHSNDLCQLRDNDLKEVYPELCRNRPTRMRPHLFIWLE